MPTHQAVLSSSILGSLRSEETANGFIADMSLLVMRESGQDHHRENQRGQGRSALRMVRASEQTDISRSGDMDQTTQRRRPLQRDAAR